MVVSEGHVKLADFGFAKRVQYDRYKAKWLPLCADYAEEHTLFAVHPSILRRKLFSKRVTVKPWTGGLWAS